MWRIDYDCVSRLLKKGPGHVATDWLRVRHPERVGTAEGRSELLSVGSGYDALFSSPLGQQGVIEVVVAGAAPNNANSSGFRRLTMPEIVSTGVSHRDGASCLSFFEIFSASATE